MFKDLITTILQTAYFPFRKLIPYQTFSYAACGAGNTLLDIFIYFITYNFVLGKQILYTPIGAISPHIGAFIIAFVITFPLGFYLNRYIVFTGSSVTGRIQLFRYFLLVIACIFLNYIFIKLFVEQFHIYPTISKQASAVLKNTK